MTSYATGTGLVQLAQFVTNTTDAQWDAYKRSSAAPWDKNSNLFTMLQVGRMEKVRSNQLLVLFTIR